MMNSLGDEIHWLSSEQYMVGSGGFVSLEFLCDSGNVYLTYG